VADTDEALLQAYQRGDAQAFHALVARFERPLWNFVRRFASSPSQAEDLVQETFLRLVRSKDEWRQESKVSTWVFTIARNLCTDEARKAVHREARSLDESVPGRGDEGSGPILMDRVAGPSVPADAALADRQIASAVEQALGTLPAEQREVFLMRETMDMSFAEIATAVGTSEATVKSRMRYALGRLRDALAAWQENDSGPTLAATSLGPTEGGRSA